nr:VP2 protein [Rotifer birnavirus strain Palavas]
QTITKTRTSKYLKSILNPASGPCHIPDDIVTRCSLRSETTTYNITAPGSGQGIFIFYPNSPFGWCGYHYTFDGTKYLYDNITGPLDTAQNLDQNYNYSRLVSQLLTLRSSTLPAGVYALNGTFNAITYDGCVSEANLPTTQYGQLLSLNSDVIDKVGNVLVGDGVAILSLPNRFDVPFCRMNDPAPSTGNTGALFRSSIVDATANLRYEMQMAPIAIGAMPAYNTILASINVDNVRSISVRGNIPLINSSRLNVTSVITYNVLYQDFTGATIYQETKAAPITIDPNYATGPNNQGGCSFMVESTFSAMPAGAKHTQPVAAVAFSIANIVQPTVSSWDVNEFGFAPFSNVSTESTSSITLTVEAVSAAFPGMNSPVTVVAYQGLAGGSVLTLSGVSNYELIPNPSLKKNLPTSYGRHDPAELNYVKMVLANREELGVKTVFALPEYKQLLTRLEEFYNLDTNTYAEA